MLRMIGMTLLFLFAAVHGQSLLAIDFDDFAIVAGSAPPVHDALMMKTETRR